MPTSGTRSFNPAASDLVLNAFSKGCGLHPAQLTAEHMRFAAIEANLLNSQWENDGVILWESALVQLPSAGVTLSSGVGNYPMDPATVALLTVYRSTGVAPDGVSNITLGPLSTTEYAQLNNPQQGGTPTSYWWDRQLTPILRLWPVPNLDNQWNLFCRVLLQIQDVVLPSGIQLDMPQRFFDAFTDGMCTRLSRHYAPQRYQDNLLAETKSWNLAVKRNAEDVMMNLAPMIGPYYR